MEDATGLSPELTEDVVPDEAPAKVPLALAEDVVPEEDAAELDAAFEDELVAAPVPEELVPERIYRSRNSTGCC
jgi:hypothetical protein